MRSAAFAVAAVAVTLAATGCSDDGEPRTDARAGGAIVVAEAIAPGSVDPALVATPAGRRAAWLAYTPPLTYRRSDGPAGTELVAGLAEELPESSDDGRSHSFALRRGLRYSDGRRLRPEDFERAVARALRLSPRGLETFGAIVGAREYAEAEPEDGSTDIAGISVDGRRITVELEAPDRLFPYALADLAAAPAPRGTPLRELRRPPPGIGPYRVAQVRRNGDLVLARDPDWRHPAIPAGNPQEIVTRTIADRAERVSAVLDGRADILEGEAPLRMLPDVRSDQDGRYAEYVTGRTLYVAIDSSRAPFRDRDVRRAVSHALDTAALARLHDGFLRPACNMLPPTVPGHAPLDPCPYGPRAGDSDLVEATNLVDGAAATGEPVIVAGETSSRDRRLARYLVRTLRKIGLAARPGPPATAHVRFAAAAPRLPHPAGYLRDGDDPVLEARVDLLEQQSDAHDVEDEWAAVDADLVAAAYAAPYGVATAGVLASERVDLERCARFHPVLGMDYSSVCLR